MTDNTEDIDWLSIGLEPPPEKPKNNLSRWAFRFCIYSLITQLGALAFILLQPPADYDKVLYQNHLDIFRLISLITLIVTIVMLVQSYRQKELGSNIRMIVVVGSLVLILIEIVSRLVTLADFASYLSS